MKRTIYLVLFSLQYMLSCRNSEHEQIDLSFARNDKFDTKFYQYKISNLTSKNLFFLIPPLFIKKIGCDDAEYSIELNYSFNNKKIFCDSTFKFNHSYNDDTGLFSYVDDSYSDTLQLCETLTAASSLSQKNRINSLCSNEYVLENLVFLPSRSSFTITYLLHVEMLKGSYEILTKRWDEYDKTKAAIINELNKELRRIDEVNTFLYYDMNILERRRVIDTMTVDK